MTAAPVCRPICDRSACRGSNGKREGATMQSSGWTEQHSQALREYLGKGLSFAEIASAINARFNTAYSRNATIGRARRMGISGPERPERPVRLKPQPKPKPARLKKQPVRAVAPTRPKLPVGERAA